MSFSFTLVLLRWYITNRMLSTIHVEIPLRTISRLASSKCVSVLLLSEFARYLINQT